MDLYNAFIAKSRYARFRPDLGRRENWDETVTRFTDWMDKQAGRNGFQISKQEKEEVHNAILNLEVMPSMRCLMTAGEAIDRDNVAGYNCSYAAVDNIRVFDEIMYILMCGTGVGFSAETKYVQKLPTVSESFNKTDTTIVVGDSKVGWASAFRELISLLYAGKIPKWDVSKVRAAGEPLKTFGGRASGPEPLVSLFEFAVNLFTKAAGRKLHDIEVHDLVCKIAEIVVVGGVRRSALISLGDLSSDRMRTAKSGQWWLDNVQRALANNSAVYEEKPEIGTFLKEWTSLYESKSGERGIFNRQAARKHIELLGRRDPNHDWGCNPCSEILLRPAEFCNLSEVVIRPEDTLDSLKRKVKIATLIGTIQATLTDFRYLRSVWRKNMEEERLLGVSLTGIMDHYLLSKTTGDAVTWLQEMKQHSIEVNKHYAALLHINPSAAITCVKPSGTVSQLVSCSSGIHPAYSEYYIRTVRADMKDPLAQFMKDMGFPCEPDVTKPHNTLVFSFPQKAAKGAILRDQTNAIEQLELYKMYQVHWCEHKPSITVYVKEDEWIKVGAWVYENFDYIGGVSFLPFSDHTYAQAPYQPCSKEEYEAAVAKMPKEIYWAGLQVYENTDMTEGAQTLACSNGGCEL
jgi:ribonucleoside-triphosphate reductase (thioredoxin)